MLLLVMRALLYFFFKYLALFGSSGLNMLTCRLSSLLILRAGLHFLADCLALLRRGRLITLASGVLLLPGQWLVTAELAEVVITPIVFRLIKPLCRSLTLGVAR